MIIVLESQCINTVEKTQLKQRLKYRHPLCVLQYVANEALNFVDEATPVPPIAMDLGSKKVL